MSLRLSRSRSAAPGHRGARRARRRAALPLSWLVLVAVGTASSASAVAAAGPAPGVPYTVHDTRRTSEVGAVFRGPVRPGGHFCTASVVDSPHRDLVVTAAHCLGGGTSGLRFVPGYHDGIAPYGVWRLGRIVADRRWTERQDPRLDVAFATVRRAHGRRVQDVVGGHPLRVHAAPDAVVRVTGYPSAAEAPLTCVNRALAVSGGQQRITCAAYTGGTSGSPWLAGDGAVVGVIGGYQQGGDTADVSYSARFGDAVAALYRRASGTA